MISINKVRRIFYVENIFNRARNMSIYKILRGSILLHHRRVWFFKKVKKSNNNIEAHAIEMQ